MSLKKCKVFITQRDNGLWDGHERQCAVSTPPGSLHILIKGKWCVVGLDSPVFSVFSLLPSQDILVILFILSTTSAHDSQILSLSPDCFHGLLKFSISGANCLPFSFFTFASSLWHCLCSICQFSSVQFSRPVVSNSLQPPVLQHARLPCHQLPELA